MTPHKVTFNANIEYSLKSVSEKIMNLAEQCVDKDVSTWTQGYKSLPLEFIDGPNDPLCIRFGTLVEQNLYFYLNQVTDEGIWDISWQWDSYPEQFEIARRYWKGILAIKRYKQLEAFNCLE